MKKIVVCCDGTGNEFMQTRDSADGNKLGEVVVLQLSKQELTLGPMQITSTPWLFDGDIFWTYDDPLSISHKARYALDHQLGGLMIWELGEDNAASDLLHAAHQSLRLAAPPALPDLTNADDSTEGDSAPPAPSR